MGYFLRYAFVVGLLVAAVAVNAQSKPVPKKLSWSDQFILDKQGKAFPMQDSFATLNGKEYNFAKSNRPAFVYISSESCLPCKFELPLYLEACKAYPGFDFVYFTTEEDSAAVMHKFGESAGMSNLYIISRPYGYFYDNQLFMNFPTKYFIDSKRK